MTHTTESLPELYMMTGQFDDHDDFKNKLTHALTQSNKVVQFRQKNIENSEYLALAEIVKLVCKQFNSIL